MNTAFVSTQLITLAQLVVGLPLLGALIAGFLGKIIGRRATHCVTIGLVGLSFVCAIVLFIQMIGYQHPTIEYVLYDWLPVNVFHFSVGILLDHLSVTMLLIVTFISLAVHIYTIGYMAEDPGYQRFFCYVSLFTFSMLILVLANNFLLLFFGWEGVGLVSYLLIGFWFTRESAVQGGLKAFLANRVGDVGFILGMAAIFTYFGSLNYFDVFGKVPTIIHQTITLFPGMNVSVITLMCLLFFIGAMGKSAQIPLHVWLPESMEGPTPISALIHAATMVTAGIYMVARLSPLFEYSAVSLSVIVVIGATTSFLMGLLAVFHYDIKRVIAYSTLSQLGYMVVALGVSAYDAAVFHLITHAFFKALLFLAAGSVIIALHHEQDMRKMGGLASFMPITYLTFAVGAFSLSAIPPFSGFFSKDSIIDAVHLSVIPGAHYAYVLVMAGSFITPLYIFRALFLTFHGEPSEALQHQGPVRESPWVILIPLIALAIPSFIVGALLIEPMLFASPRLLGHSIFVLPEHDVLGRLAHDYQGASAMSVKAPHTLMFWLSLMGIVTAWFLNLACPSLASFLKKRCSWLMFIIQHQYGFDDFNHLIFVRGVRRIGRFFYAVTDLKIIDGLFVNGSGKCIRALAERSRRLQTGFLYDYAFAMLIGIVLLMVWLILG